MLIQGSIDDVKSPTSHQYIEKYFGSDYFNQTVLIDKNKKLKKAELQKSNDASLRLKNLIEKKAQTMIKSENLVQSEDFIISVITKFNDIMTENVRVQILTVLKANRFGDDIEKTIDLCNKNIDYVGRRSIVNRKYYELIYGDGYDDYMKKLVNKANESKNNTKNKDEYQVNRFNSLATRMVESNNLDYSIDFVANVMKSINYIPETPGIRTWLIDMFTYIKFETVEDAITNINNIINFDGNRAHSYEWYLLRYGKEEADIRKQIASDRFKGKNNPAYQHGGIYSPFSTKFIHGYDKDWNHQFRINHSNFQKTNQNNTFLPIYYSNNIDYINHQAKNKDYYINKYGYDIGLSLYLKKKYIMSISLNKKMVNIENFNPVDINSRFYVLDLNNGFYKYGITTNSIITRYKGVFHKYNVLIDYENNLDFTAKLELKFSEKFNLNHITREEKIKNFGYTETIKNITDKELLDFFNKCIDVS